jgi:PIN domain-containing protein
VNGATLDSGALIAFERGSPRMLALVERAASLGLGLAVPAGVVAQTWRDGVRQARLARLLRAPLTEIVALDEPTARAVGVVCGRAGVTDVVDVAVVVCARERGHHVVTCDPDDLHAIDPSLTVVRP